MRKSLWSPDEDEKLRRYVTSHGCGNWSDVAKHTGLKRCGKSCRLRWINYLRPDLKRGPFSPDEIRLVVGLHARLGNCWSKIANHLPGRTDNDVKNFWHSYTRSRRFVTMNNNVANVKTTIINPNPNHSNNGPVNNDINQQVNDPNRAQLMPNAAVPSITTTINHSSNNLNYDNHNQVHNHVVDEDSISNGIDQNRATNADQLAIINNSNAVNSCNSKLQDVSTNYHQKAAKLTSSYNVIDADSAALCSNNINNSSNHHENMQFSPQYCSNSINPLASDHSTITTSNYCNRNSLISCSKSSTSGGTDSAQLLMDSTNHDNNINNPNIKISAMKSNTALIPSVLFSTNDAAAEHHHKSASGNSYFLSDHINTSINSTDTDHHHHDNHHNGHIQNYNSNLHKISSTGHGAALFNAGTFNIINPSFLNLHHFSSNGNLDQYTVQELPPLVLHGAELAVAATEVHNNPAIQADRPPEGLHSVLWSFLHNRPVA